MNCCSRRCVIADYAHVGDRKRLDELEVVHVSINGPGAREITKIRKERCRGIELRNLAIPAGKRSHQPSGRAWLPSRPQRRTATDR